MRKILTVVVILLLSTSLANAENPDSRPSIYIGGGGKFASGEYSIHGLDQDLSSSNFGLGTQFTIPVSENSTILFSLSYDHTSSTAEENFYFYKRYWWKV